MELRDYLNVIRARKWVIVQAVIIVTLAALVASLISPPSYQAQAKILISERDAGAAIIGTSIGEFANQPERGLQTQVQLMQMRPILEVAIRKLNLRTTPDSLMQRLSVSALGQTNVVVITAEDGNPQEAARIANAIAEAYVAWSRESKRESMRAAAEEVDVRLREAKAEILALGKRINAAANREKPKEANEFQAELQIATGLYTTLAEKAEQLRINEQLETGSGSLVAAAAVPAVASSPNLTRNVALGLAVGLVFGLGMAFLYEYLDNTIKSTEEAERLYGAPVLGHIPLEKFDKSEKRRLTIVSHPGSPAAESYRVLRNSLDFINFEHNIKTLLVTSAAPAEGKSTVASNLAASLAQAGAKVVLVSCDFRRPTTEQFFGVRNTIGLSDVLTGANTLQEALQRSGDEQLLVLTAGKMPPNPSELLGSAKMADLFQNLEEWADWVIVDSPPLLAVADAAAVARWTDGVLMVTRGGTSTRDAARKGREMLSKVGARTVGVVVWGLDEAGMSRGYGYYYDGYYGSYYYADYYSGKSKKGKGADSGAKATVPVQAGLDQGEDLIYIPQQSPGRRVAVLVGRVMTGMLSFLAVLAVLGVVLYFLDQYFGWGLAQSLASLIN